MKFNINKLRSWGLRYLVCDESGQIWAHEKLPVRVIPFYSIGYWRITDRFLAPEVHTYSSKEEWEAYRKHWARVAKEHFSDCPIEISWKDEPYDMVAHNLFPIQDLKTFD